ncbi:DUF58 domain-containing protein [Pseudomonas saudiphocaensis]|uniref:Putative transmembrane protein n=1 Tax=Pseudomonas saudiphocaensis TaxID=1499686 RepID=A0A078LXC0_9PSED|nr:DUF58 domain-containing protein [Pseudomonas saudiphocaensis]CDZ95895.1 putative transmembrane protein [Pseudomonas saudiphocaensis]
MNPTRRLLYALLLLLGLAVPLGIASALGQPAPSVIHTAWWGLLLCLGLTALFDAWNLRRLPPPELQRRLPGNLALNRWHDVRLQVRHAQARPLHLDLFDHLPAGMEFEHLPRSLTLSHGEQAELTYRVRPEHRGLFSARRCEVRLYGPLGLWRQRRLLPLESQARVYPDFTRLHGASLMAVDSWLSRLGVSRHPRRGLGLDFHQLRDYREGDTLRQIDWKATARKRSPIAREFQDERDQQILLMLDCGRRMRSQDGTLSHFDHALNASLLLGYVALRQGDALGLYSFATEQRRFIPPAKGREQLNTLLNGVYDLAETLQPADFSRAASDVLERQKRRALVIILSNLRDEDDQELLDAVRRLSGRHRVLVASLREPIIDTLRQQPVNGFQDALNYCGTLDYLNARDRLHERLQAHGVPVLEALPHEIGPQLIGRYLAWKRGGVI